MDAIRRKFIRKSIAKKSRFNIDSITKDELVQYISDTNAIVINKMKELTRQI